MATKRQRWGSEGVTIKPKKKKKNLPEAFDTFTPWPSLERLPDNVTLLIMFYLDSLSILKLSRVCKRFYHLSRDEYLWINVDMSTLPYMDIRNTKKFIDQKLSPKLHTISIQSSYELRGRAARKPKVDRTVLNTLAEKCPNIKNISLINCDLAFLSNTGSGSGGVPEPDCNLLSLESLEKVSFVHCNTHIHWLEHARWPCLAHLSLQHTVKTSEFEIKAIMRNDNWINTLDFLDLTGCYRINDACIKVLCQQNKDLAIKTLVLSGTNVTGACLEHLPNLNKLEELNISNTKGITRDSLLKIPTLLPSLKVLIISMVPPATAASNETDLHEARSDGETDHEASNGGANRSVYDHLANAMINTKLVLLTEEAHTSR